MEYHPLAPKMAALTLAPFLGGMGRELLGEEKQGKDLVPF